MENAGNPFQPGSTNLPSSAPPAPRAAPGCRTVLSWTFVLLIGGTIYALAAAVGWGGSALVVTLGGAESTISMIGVAVLAAASTVPTVPHGMFLYSVLKAWSEGEPWQPLAGSFGSVAMVLALVVFFLPALLPLVALSGITAAVSFSLWGASVAPWVGLLAPAAGVATGLMMVALTEGESNVE